MPKLQSHTNRCCTANPTEGSQRPTCRGANPSEVKQSSLILWTRLTHYFLDPVRYNTVRYSTHYLIFGHKSPLFELVRSNCQCGERSVFAMRVGSGELFSSPELRRPAEQPLPNSSAPALPGAS